MRRFRAFHGRYCLEVTVVVVPLLAILVLQYVSSRRLAKVEVIAHQTTISQYLDVVGAEVRWLYEGAARAMLGFPEELLVAKRFDEIQRHFGETDASTARLLFTGSLDGCFCLARYYDPVSGTTQVGGVSRSLLNFASGRLPVSSANVTPLQQLRRRAGPARRGRPPGTSGRGSPGPAEIAVPPPPARSPPSVESSDRHATA